MGKRGFTDNSVAMGLLRGQLKDFILEHPRTSRPTLLRHGMGLLDELFEKYESAFKGYIVENAINQADKSIEGDGVSPVTRLPAQKKTFPNRAAVRAANEKKLAAEFEAVIVKRTIAALASDSTEHEVWEMGGSFRKLGRKGSQKLIWRTQREALEKLGIQEV